MLTFFGFASGTRTNVPPETCKYLPREWETVSFGGLYTLISDITNITLQMTPSFLRRSNLRHCGEGTVMTDWGLEPGTS
jgi:hypothetical protein